MNKLIEQFVANPSDKTRLRLQTYLNKHPMAVCLASPEQREILKVNGLY
jgi:hypothetical protein